MTQQTNSTPRRDFLKTIGLSAVPFIVPGHESHTRTKTSTDASPVNFVSDGLGFSPEEYLSRLSEINQQAPIHQDYYGSGGVTKALEERFAAITGKEKAIYLPTGTMANQLAIKLLNGQNTKVIVPENSHIFRDEADAAQSVHDLRLIPVGKDKPYFNLEDVQKSIDYLDQGEVFKSGLGTIAIENPVRRSNGAHVPLEVIRDISDFSRENNYKLHLDGARIHIASAFTNVTIAEYAGYFDTVYISLYKYLNAAGGAILCGDATLIDQLVHQIKIYGGTTYQTWTNTAMALHYLDGIEDRWKEVALSTYKLIDALNALDGVSIEPVENGTNIYFLKLADTISPGLLAENLLQEHNIRIRRPDSEGLIRLAVNESMLSMKTEDIISAWKSGIAAARM